MFVITSQNYAGNKQKVCKITKNLMFEIYDKTKPNTEVKNFYLIAIKLTSFQVTNAAVV
jgi:hypothetical protein